jgi:peptidyl-prolyl cis-trans isomerase A (cyclophilin A)
MKTILFLFVTAFLLGCGQSSSRHPQIIIYTSAGDIKAELYPEKAPKTVAAFLSYVDSGFYTNSSFYRVVLAEGISSANNAGLIQGGIWQTNERQHPNVPGIPHESTKETGLSHTNGTLSLARTAPGTANTEFFICIGDQTQFDFGKGSTADTLGFAAFGKVLKGMSVVRAIQQEKKNGESLVQQVLITKIERL